MPLLEAWRGKEHMGSSNGWLQDVQIMSRPREQHRTAGKHRSLPAGTSAGAAVGKEQFETSWHFPALGRKHSADILMRQ